MAAGARETGFESYSFSELVAQVDAGRLVIPPFQREVVWDQERMASLWDSMYRAYPIGSLLCWRTATELTMLRAVGGAPLDAAFARQPDQSGAEFGYVLDGQQRLTAIYVGMKGGVGSIASKPTENYTLYFDATADLTDLKEDAATDALDLDADIVAGPDDKPAQSRFFLFESKARTRRKKLIKAGLPATLIVSLSDPEALAPKRLDALTNDPNVPRVALARLERLAKLLRDYRVPLTRVTGLSLADVCAVYLRINRSGRRLDPADIIIGAVFGAAGAGPGGFNLRLKFHEIHEELARLNPRWRGYEIHPFVQLIGTCVRESLERVGDESAIKFGIEPTKLFNLQPEVFVPIWDDIQRAIIAALSFLIREGIYDPGKMPGSYLPMALCAFMFKRDEPDEEQRRLISQWVWRTAFQRQAMDSGTDIATARRDFFEPLASGQTPVIAPLQIAKSDLLRSQEPSSTMYKAMLGFLSHRGPRDFANNGAWVTFNPQYPDTFMNNEPTVHHICPQGFLTGPKPAAKPRAAGGPRNHNELYHPQALLNLCLIPGPTNRAIGDLSPLKYFRRYERQDAFPEILQADLIPRAFALGHYFDSQGYERFLEDRYALFQTAMRELLPDVVLEWDNGTPSDSSR